MVEFRDAVECSENYIIRAEENTYILTTRSHHQFF